MALNVSIYSVFLYIWSTLSTKNQVDELIGIPEEGVSGNQTEKINWTLEHISKFLV